MNADVENKIIKSKPDVKAIALAHLNKSQWISHLNKLIHSERGSSFLVVVALPLLLLTAYYLFFAADRYVSTASFKISQSGNKSVDLGAGAALAAAAGVSSQNDEYIIENYILSMDMLKLLEKEYGLRKHYTSHPDADVFSSLSSTATLEQFARFYQEHIDIVYDELSGLLIVEVQAFDPEYAAILLKAILNASEKMVNEKTHLLASSQLAFIQSGVDEAAKRIANTQGQLIKFQNSHALFNPELQSISVSGIISTLEQVLATTKAEISTLKQYQRYDSPQIISLQHKIKGLKTQIKLENKRLVNSGDQEAMNEIYAQFKELELEVRVAQENYATALAALQLARMEASRKLKHLVVISSPYVPEEASYPEKLYNLITLAAVLIMLFGLVRMLLTTIKEHQD